MPKPNDLSAALGRDVARAVSSLELLRRAYDGAAFSFLPPAGGELIFQHFGAVASCRHLLERVQDQEAAAYAPKMARAAAHIADLHERVTALLWARGHASPPSSGPSSSSSSCREDHDHDHGPQTDGVVIDPATVRVLRYHGTKDPVRLRRRELVGIYLPQMARVAVHVFLYKLNVPASLLRQTRAAALWAVEALASLEHPNIDLPPIGLMESADMFAFLKPLQPSIHLQSFLLSERGRALTLLQRVRIAAGVSSGLAYLHVRGIVHCDFCAIEVNVDSRHVAHVSSGYVESTMELRRDPMFVSAHCTAPEAQDPRGRGKRAVDYAIADVYGLGFVVYETITGRIVRSQADAVLDLRGVPDAVVAVINGCVAVRPEDRWSAARAEVELSTFAASLLSRSSSIGELLTMAERPVVDGARFGDRLALDVSARDLAAMAKAWARGGGRGQRAATELAVTLDNVNADPVLIPGQRLAGFPLCVALQALYTWMSSKETPAGAVDAMRASGVLAELTRLTTILPLIRDDPGRIGHCVCDLFTGPHVGSGWEQSTLDQLFDDVMLLAVATIEAAISAGEWHSVYNASFLMHAHIVRASDAVVAASGSVGAVLSALQRALVQGHDPKALGMAVTALYSLSLGLSADLTRTLRSVVPGVLLVLEQSSDDVELLGAMLIFRRLATSPAGALDLARNDRLMPALLGVCLRFPDSDWLCEHVGAISVAMAGVVDLEVVVAAIESVDGGGTVFARIAATFGVVPDVPEDVHPLLALVQQENHV